MLSRRVVFTGSFKLGLGIVKEFKLGLGIVKEFKLGLGTVVIGRTCALI